jgi:hypothetical protein
MLEYRELNGPRALTDADRQYRQELEEHQELLVRGRSGDPKIEELEKSLADRQAQESRKDRESLTSSHFFFHSASFSGLPHAR